MAQQSCASLAPLPNPDAIPAELRERPQWCAGTYVTRNGKRTKLPLDAKTGKAASTTDPTTWSAFDVA